MNLIILSDTHIKYGQSLLRSLPEELILMIRRSDIIIHAGDFETLSSYRELETLGKLSAVHGDTDSTELTELLPERMVIKIEGLNIGIIHHGQLTSENTNGLYYLAREMDVDILVFGHFHHPIVHRRGVLLLSPGSATVPGITDPSAIQLEIKNKTVQGKIIRCKGTTCTFFEYEKS